MKAAVITKPHGLTISDHTARQIYTMCEKMWSNPKIQKGYAEWHLKEYGCLPEEAKPISSINKKKP